LSSPLLDRVAIRWNCNKDSWFKDDVTLEGLRGMIKTAWETQLKRTNCLNEDLDMEDIKKFVVLKDDADTLLTRTVLKNDWSTRTHNNVLKVARTVADMHGSLEVTIDDVRTAIKLHASTSLEELY